MNHFHAKWVQESTRFMKTGDRLRWICAFIEKGFAQYLHKNGLDLRDENNRSDFFWMIEAPPRLFAHLCGIQQWHEDVYKEYLSLLTHGF